MVDSDFASGVTIEMIDELTILLGVDHRESSSPSFESLRTRGVGALSLLWATRLVLTASRVFMSKPYLQASIAAGIALLLGCSSSSEEDTSTAANDPTGNDEGSADGDSTGETDSGNDEADEGNDPSGPGDESADEGNDDSSDDSSTGNDEMVPESWQTIHLLTVRSAAYVNAVDLNGDDTPELLLSTLMEEGSPAPIGMPPTGALRRLTFDGPNLSDWSDEVLVPLATGLGFINEPQVLDVNGDDALDIVLNTGFLSFSAGSHQYLAGPEFTGEPTPFATIGAPGSSWFWHQTAQADLDGDDNLDIVTTRTDYENPTTFSVAIDWYRHDGEGGFEAFEIDTGHCGVSLRLHDVDGDEDQDIVCSQFFGPPTEPTLVWLEQVQAPAEANEWLGEWTPHTIDDTTGLGFDIHFVDMDGDDVEELLFANHNNQNNPAVASIPSGIYTFAIPDDPTTPWTKTVLDEGYTVVAPDMGNPASQGAPGHIAYGDLDNNDLIDVVATGDGADGLFVIWQHQPGQYTRRMIADGPMYGQPSVADLDGDDSLEVVATQHMYPEGFVLPEGNLRIYKPYL